MGSISNVVAGSKYLEDEVSMNEDRYIASNHLPQACAFRVHDNEQYPVSVVFEGEESNLKMQCIFGMNGCEEEMDGMQSPYTHIGAVHNGRCEERHYLSAANMNGEEVLDIEGMAREELI